VLASTALLLGAAVSERRVTERREREAATMLRVAQQAGSVATFVWDFRSQIADCSPEFFRIFGLPPRNGPMSSAEWARFVHPDDRDRMEAHLGRAIEGGEPATADYRITTADGNLRWLSYTAQLQATPAGDRLLGIVVDITDRKQLETELRRRAADLRESRDVLSLAMRGGSMGAWSRDLSSDNVWWSRELEEIFSIGRTTSSTSGSDTLEASGGGWRDEVAPSMTTTDGPAPCTGSPSISPTASTRKWRWPRPTGSWRGVCANSRRSSTCCRSASASPPIPSAVTSGSIAPSPGRSASPSAPTRRRPLRLTSARATSGS
jgi:PAS domain S-box-containing protein